MIRDEQGNVYATGASEHAFVNGEGRPRRMPRETRDAFQALALNQA